MASARVLVVRTTNDNQAAVRRINEDASETFESHTPLALNAAGRVIAWAGATLTGLVGSIIGIALEVGANLTTAATAETLSFGSVPHQSSALNIPRGAPINDGRVGVLLARPETVFRGQINPTGQSLLESDLGEDYGMTIDTDGQWYIDKAKTLTSDGGSSEAVVRIVGRDPNEDGLVDSVRRTCFFQFLSGATQQLA